MKKKKKKKVLSHTLALLDHSHDIANAIASLGVDGQGLACEGLDKELHLVYREQRRMISVRMIIADEFL